MTRHAPALRSLLLLFCGTALAVATAACDDEPTQEGAYAVGTTAYHLVDPGRPEPETEAPGDHRELMIRAFYPTGARDGVVAGYFLDELEARRNADVNFLPADAFAITSRAWLDAPVADGRFPVLVFSPGFGMPPSLFTLLLEDVASRGYVVLAIAHPYKGGVVVYPDGRVAEPTAVPDVPVDEWRDPLIATWSADQRFTLDWAVGQHTSGDRLRGHLALDRAGVIGHSIGGAAAAQSCADDPRFRACSTLDGSVGTRVDPAAIARPFLLARAEVAGIPESTLSAFFDGLGGAAYRVRIDGGGHYTFSDLPAIAEHVRATHPEVDLDALGLGELGLGVLAPERGRAIVVDHAVAFFDRFLRGRSAPVLDGSDAYPEVEIDRR